MGKSKLFGLTSLVEELASCALPFSGFSASVYELDTFFTLDLGTIAHYMKDTPHRDYSHKIICPFFCLKYKLAIAVFEHDGQERCTYYYGFDPLKGQVICTKQRGSYHILVDHHEMLYLSVTTTQCGFYKPNEQHICHGICYHDRFHHKYAHMGDQCFKQCLLQSYRQILE